MSARTAFRLLKRKCGRILACSACRRASASAGLRDQAQQPEHRGGDDPGERDRAPDIGQRPGDERGHEAAVQRRQRHDHGEDGGESGAVGQPLQQRRKQEQHHQVDEQQRLDECRHGDEALERLREARRGEQGADGGGRIHRDQHPRDHAEIAEVRQNVRKGLLPYTHYA